MNMMGLPFHPYHLQVTNNGIFFICVFKRLKTSLLSWIPALETLQTSAVIHVKRKGAENRPQLGKKTLLRTEVERKESWPGWIVMTHQLILTRKLGASSYFELWLEEVCLMHWNGSLGNSHCGFLTIVRFFSLTFFLARSPSTERSSHRETWIRKILPRGSCSSGSGGMRKTSVMWLYLLCSHVNSRREFHPTEPVPVFISLYPSKPWFFQKSHPEEIPFVFFP